MSRAEDEKLVDQFEAMYRKSKGVHGRLANANPKLSRGLVWCRKCGRCESVNAAECLRSGWPKCCAETMTIDAPEEQIP